MDVIQRVKQYAGRSMEDRRRPTNACITARETIELADYIVKLETALNSTTRELQSAIDELNSTAKSKISVTDLQPPDYHDYQSVHENFKLLSERHND